MRPDAGHFAYGDRGWSFWERGIGVPGRGGLEDLGEESEDLLEGLEDLEDGVGIPGRGGSELLRERGRSNWGIGLKEYLRGDWSN